MSVTRYALYYFVCALVALAFASEVLTATATDSTTELLLVQTSLGSSNDTHLDFNLLVFDTATNNLTTIAHSFYRLGNNVTLDQTPSWRCGTLGDFAIAAGTWREPNGALNASLTIVDTVRQRADSFPIESEFTTLLFDAKSGSVFFATNGSSIIQQFELNAGVYTLAYVIDNSTSSFGLISYRHFAIDPNNQVIYAAGVSIEGAWVIAKFDMILGNTTISQSIFTLGDAFVTSIDDLGFGTIYGSQGYPIAALSLSNSEYALGAMDLSSGQILDPSFETIDGPIPTPITVDGSVVFLKSGSILVGASLDGKGIVYITTDSPDFIGIGVYASSS